MWNTGISLTHWLVFTHVPRICTCHSHELTCEFVGLLLLRSWHSGKAHLMQHNEAVYDNVNVCCCRCFASKPSMI